MEIINPIINPVFDNNNIIINPVPFSQFINIDQLVDTSNKSIPVSIRKKYSYPTKGDTTLGQYKMNKKGKPLGGFNFYTQRTANLQISGKTRGEQWKDLTQKTPQNILPNYSKTATNIDIEKGFNYYQSRNKGKKMTSKEASAQWKKAKESYKKNVKNPTLLYETQQRVIRDSDDSDSNWSSNIN